MSAAASSSGETFRARTVILGVVGSVLAAAAFFVLSSYAPDFQQGANMRATAASKSAAGYAGLVRFLDLNGHTVIHRRTGAEIGRPGLLIVFLDPAEDDEAYADLIAENDAARTLVVLPKWTVGPIEGRRAWVERFGPLPPYIPLRFLAPFGAGEVVQEYEDGAVTVAGADLTFDTPVQSVRGPAFSPAKEFDADPAVLAKVADRPVYLLTDPDLFNNANIDDPDVAFAALTLIEQMAEGGDIVAFSSSPMGGGAARNLGKLLLEPPFLPLTVILLVTAILAVINGFNRFGPVKARARAIAFGKRSLIDVTAELLRRAGRLGALGPDYADLALRRAAARLGAPPALTGEKLDAWLDAQDREEEGGFRTRIEAARRAHDETGVQRAAAALHDWISRRSV